MECWCRLLGWSIHLRVYQQPWQKKQREIVFFFCVCFGCLLVSNEIWSEFTYLTRSKACFARKHSFHHDKTSSFFPFCKAESCLWEKHAYGSRVRCMVYVLRLYTLTTYLMQNIVTFNLLESSSEYDPMLMI